MRLTKVHRSAVLKAVLDKAQKKKLQVLRGKVRKIAQDAANHMYPKSVLEWMDARPRDREAFVTRASFALNIVVDKQAEAQPVLFVHLLSEARASYDRRIALTAPVKVLAENNHTDALTVRGSAGKRLLKILAQYEVLAEERTTLRNTVNGALSACTTFKQVQENYPSLAKYLPKIQPATKALSVTDADVAKVLPK